MARGRLSPMEIEILKQNPYVEDVSHRRIMYTYEFKCRFMEQYLSGMRPVEIFRQAGFDVAVVGEKRIERATARWKALYAGNGVEGLKGTAEKSASAEGSRGNTSVSPLAVHEAGEPAGKRHAQEVQENSRELAAYESRINHLEKMMLDMSGRFSLLEKEASELVIRTELLAGKLAGSEKSAGRKQPDINDLYGLIRTAVENYPGRISVKGMCEAFNVPRQGYYDYLKKCTL